MATFVLVHGGFHGGWCWAPLVERLEALGHDTVAPDMPIDDPADDS
jgi:pimeloyl-ACP methyl ester carboxylesterase